MFSLFKKVINTIKTANIDNNIDNNNTIITCKFCGKSHYKKYGFLPSLEGKQAEKCIILKQKQDKLYINALGESFELKIKNNDIYTKNLLELIKVYMNDSENIENINIDRVKNGQKPLDTYRIIFNRIVIKRIRCKFRFYVQILYEGRPWK